MKKLFRRIGIIGMSFAIGLFLCSFDMGEETMIKESEINEKDN